jgi:nicotinamide riboside kinase
MNQNAYKIAFIGSHGVGKTTLCYGLAARLKVLDYSLDFVGEVARRCPLPINRGTTLAAQSWILHTQIAEELVASARYEVVICDRSVLDNFVYLILSTGAQPTLEELIHHWTKSYDLLVRVPITKDPTADGLRSTDPNFQRAIHERLGEEILNRGLDVLDLQGIDREHWLDVVETTVHKHLRPATQLELL